MILTLIGFACIIMGVIVNVFGKRMIKSNPNLRIGKVKSIEETEDGYQVSLDYIPNPDGKIIEDQILLEKKPKKAEILIEMTPYGLELYQGKTLVIVMPIVFWIVGLILLVIS